MTETGDADPGNPEVGPQPDVYEAIVHAECICSKGNELLWEAAETVGDAAEFFQEAAVKMTEDFMEQMFTMEQRTRQQEEKFEKHSYSCRVCKRYFDGIIRRDRDAEQELIQDVARKRDEAEWERRTEAANR